MIRFRATLTGAKWRLVSKARTARVDINKALVAAAPRRKLRRLINVSTDYADYADLLICAICVICGHGFLSGMADADGGDSDAGAVYRTGVDLRTEVRWY